MQWQNSCLFRSYLADKNVLERLLAPLRKVVEYEK